MEKKDIVSYNYDELQDEIKSIGEKPFRAKQIYAWLHEKLAEEFDEMTNLSKALREKLDQAYEIRKESGRPSDLQGGSDRKIFV